MGIIIGIDVGKNTHTAGCIDDSGQKVGKPIKISNNKAGFEELLAYIQKVVGLSTWTEKNASMSSVRIGMEATGHYHNNLMYYLREQGYHIFVANPLQVAKFRGVGSLRKVKTDKTDCYLIANEIRMINPQEVFIPGEQTESLKYLTRARQSAVSNRTGIKNRTRGDIDSIFPEFESIFKDREIFSATGMAIMKIAITPEEVLRYPKKEMLKVVDRASRGLCGNDLVERLYKQASDSIGTKRSDDVKEMIIRSNLDTIEHLTGQITNYDKEIKRRLEETPGSDILMSFKGIGPVYAAMLLGEVGDFSRFTTYRQLIAMAGLDPSVNQSGSSLDSNGPISKRGNSHLRYAFCGIAQSASVYDETIKAFCTKKRNEGKAYGVAINACAIKVARIIFAMMKTKTPYQPDYKAVSQPVAITLS